MFAQNAFSILRMKQCMQISLLPLREGKTVIIERGLVVIDRTSIRAKFGDVKGREIKEPPEFPFALPDLRFRLLCRGDVRHGTHKFEVARRSLQGANVDV